MSASPSPPAAGAAGQGTQELAPGPAAAVRALQVALTAEHAAVYGYGVAGAHLTGARQKAAARAWAGHESARDTLAAMITALGAQPVAAATAYRLPFPVHNAPAAITLAALLEDRVAAAYLGLVALTGARLRMFGARAVQAAALRATEWRGRTLAFPGLEVPGPGPVTPAASASHPTPGAGASHPTPGAGASHPTPGAGASHPTPGASGSGPASPSPPPTGPAGG